MKLTRPAYKKIYEDMLRLKFPDKRKDCETILSKDDLTEFDILQIENILFRKTETEKSLDDKRHRSYDRDTILKILAYQKANKLNNTQVASRYGLSRNTVAGWKKRFLLIRISGKNDNYLNMCSL
ncbi:hypothetical protein ACM46_16755 [Chryseobacterium angstadtii]|uniref:Transposase n=1 Tax=Chryseobacterium angstadtii TaxID=558151 RepID=A0A0J7I5J9_9FLAO|nr:hypothetical protein [Chryseobacterium angstadtii]KMQ61638.1 hypothetical protein ACM46_16755 [Chryseobacterium angstadtii]